MVTYWRHRSLYLFVLLLLLPALKASTHHHHAQKKKSEGGVVVVGCQQQQLDVFLLGMRMSQLYDLFKEFLEDGRGASPSWTPPDSDVFFR